MGRRTGRAAPLGIALDAGGPDSLHQQIREQIRRAILERRIARGARLPSSRLLAAELGCARGTVLTAIDQLVAEGYLIPRPASGVSVATDLPDPMLAAPPLAGAPPHAGADPPALPARTLAVLRQAASAPVDSGAPIAFPLGQPDRTAFPFPLWAKFLEQDWRRPAWQLAGAPHPFGHPALRQAIAAYLGAARGFACAPAAIVVTAGVRQSVSLFARMVLAAGARAWIEEPGYPGMAEALAASGVHAVPVPVDASGFQPDAAWAAAPDARLAIVAASHHFPFGTVLSLQRRLALLRWAEQTRGWIVEDDYDGEYRYAGRPLAPLRALDRGGRVAYLGSFSKLLFPALRLSYIVVPDPLVPAAEAIMATLSTPAPLLGQGALARFIAEGHLTAHLRRTRLLYARRQQGLIQAAGRHLAGLMVLSPVSGGMHLVARPDRALAPDFDDQAATRSAAQAGIRVAPLSRCYRRDAKLHGLLLGYAGTPDADIEPAIRSLADSLAGCQARNRRVPSARTSKPRARSSRLVSSDQ